MSTVKWELQRMIAMTACSRGCVKMMLFRGVVRREAPVPRPIGKCCTMVPCMFMILGRGGASARREAHAAAAPAFQLTPRGAWDPGGFGLPLGAVDRRPPRPVRRGASHAAPA
ncbi:unnamed protein product [Prorocentrum cordatum]|uniref:Uncharacterized protein n=1 Tax=Prorocentrum cordatum TaxID=2364126 RepID=A0ABN9UQV3_9DINO|nr:unnamed protein product [Polarella glacialis]